MEKFKRAMLLGLLALCFTSGIAQVKLSGTIVDAKTQKALVGVTIFEKGTTNGTFSGEDGKFNLDVRTDEGWILVRLTGYNDAEYEFYGAEKEIKIELRQKRLGATKINAGIFLPIAAGGKLGFGFNGMVSSKFPFLYRSTGLRLNLHGNYHSLLSDSWAGFGVGLSRPFFGITFHLNGGYQWQNLDGDFRYPYFNPEISTWIRIPGLGKYGNLGLGYVKLYEASEGSFFRIWFSMNII